MSEGAKPEGDRMPMPALDDLKADQRAAMELITSGPRGSIIGPFVPLLRSPELMTRVQLVGEYLRFQSVLDDDLVELVILLVARHWDQQFEWGFHHPIALDKGLPREVIEDIAAGRPLGGGREEVGLVHALVTHLLRTKQVPTEVYGEAVAALGEQRVVEVVVTTGYYTMLAMTMNAARTPAPEGAPRLDVKGG